MNRASLAVVDTNVVVAGLLTRSADSPPALILDRMLTGELRFAVSIELLAEYRAVLLRPRIRNRHGLEEPEVDTLLAELARNAVVSNAEPSDVPSPDVGDQHLWDLLAALEDVVLVTGDQVLVSADGPFRVLSPAAFVAER